MFPRSSLSIHIHTHVASAMRSSHIKPMSHALDYYTCTRMPTNGASTSVVFCVRHHGMAQNCTNAFQPATSQGHGVVMSSRVEKWRGETLGHAACCCAHCRTLLHPRRQFSPRPTTTQVFPSQESYRRSFRRSERANREYGRARKLFPRPLNPLDPTLRDDLTRPPNAATCTTTSHTKKDESNGFRVDSVESLQSTFSVSGRMCLCECTMKNTL